MQKTGRWGGEDKGIKQQPGGTTCTFGHSWSLVKMRKIFMMLSGRSKDGPICDDPILARQVCRITATIEDGIRYMDQRSSFRTFQ